MILATSNLHKRDEFQRLMPSVSWETLGEWERAQGTTASSPVEETGHTFADNAIIKARAAWELTRRVCLADDSGLCVDALDGAPGIYSARYVEGSDQDRYRALLKEMQGIESTSRTAAFHCVLAIYGLDPINERLIKERLPLANLEWHEGCLLAYGECRGYIRETPSGEEGFGYDPIFNLPDGRSFASISGEEKDKFSHRGIALQALSVLSEIFT